VPKQKRPGRETPQHVPYNRAYAYPSRLIASLSYNWRVLTDEDKQWIIGQLEKVETTLLTEFHKWASPVELRQRSHAAALRALDAEVESLSDRLKNLEGR
jgi:hypothetical protein